MGIDEKQGSAAAALPAQQTSAYSLNAPQISGSMEENNNGHFFDIKSIRCLLLLFGLFFFFFSHCSSCRFSFLCLLCFV